MGSSFKSVGYAKKTKKTVKQVRIKTTGRNWWVKYTYSVLYKEYMYYVYTIKTYTKKVTYWESQKNSAKVSYYTKKIAGLKRKAAKLKKACDSKKKVVKKDVKKV